MLALVSIPEPTWRAAASAHSERMRALVAPGFVSAAAHLAHDGKPSRRFAGKNDGWLALNPKHPVYNFLLEYYSLKGAKSTRRLGRWSPKQDNADGVLLEGASDADVEAGHLSPKGAIFSEAGIVYEPRAFAQSATGGQAAAYLWYRDILARTLDAPPVLNCYNRACASMHSSTFPLSSMCMCAPPLRSPRGCASRSARMGDAVLA